MGCLSPITIVKRGVPVVREGKTYVYHKDLMVPCSKCAACLHRRVNDWVFRLIQEQKNSISSYFITLTYDPDNVPRSENNFKTLYKKDLQDFFKRLRYFNGDQSKIKYYACGEYGSLNSRPHYHAIVFNILDTSYIEKAWGMGITSVDTVTKKSIAYCCKYLDKYNFNVKHARDDRAKEFSIMSRELGLCYLTPAMIKYYYDDLTRVHVHINGKKQAMPRYYRKKLNFTDDQLFEQTQHIQSVLVDERNNLDKRIKKLYGDRIHIDEYIRIQNMARHDRYFHNIQLFNNGERLNVRRKGPEKVSERYLKKIGAI